MPGSDVVSEARDVRGFKRVVLAAGKGITKVRVRCKLVLPNALGRHPAEIRMFEQVLQELVDDYSFRRSRARVVSVAAAARQESNRPIDGGVCRARLKRNNGLVIRRNHAQTCEVPEMETGHSAVIS